MHITFDWIQLATLVGVVQGILLVAVLVGHTTKRTANLLLGALMAAFAVYLAQNLYYTTGLVASFPHFFGISYPLPWIFGPLVYLYARAASDNAWRFKAREAWHFVPVVAVVCITLPIYFRSGSDKIALFERIQAGDVPTLLAILNPFKYVSGLGYSLTTIVLLRTHWRRIKNSYSNTDRVNLRWLLWLAGAAAFIWLLAVSSTFANLIPGTISRQGNAVVPLAIALVVYSIGYMGLRQPEIYRYDGPNLSEADVAAAVGSSSLAQEPEAGAARYERSGLGAAEAEQLKSQLLALMTRERPYRDPDLTLADLAEQLKTSSHKLSEVLNGELAQSFYDFVNSYRVSDVRRRLTEPKSEHLTVLTLALDAGFASKSTFNQVFKKLTGQTPSSYRRTLST